MRGDFVVGIAALTPYYWPRLVIDGWRGQKLARMLFCGFDVPRLDHLLHEVRLNHVMDAFHTNQLHQSFHLFQIRRTIIWMHCCIRKYIGNKNLNNHSYIEQKWHCCFLSCINSFWDLWLNEICIRVCILSISSSSALPLPYIVLSVFTLCHIRTDSLTYRTTNLNLQHWPYSMKMLSYINKS